MLFRYVAISGLLLGLAWGLAHWTVEGRSAYGHFRESGGERWVSTAMSKVVSAGRTAQETWSTWWGALQTENSADPSERKNTTDVSTVRRVAKLERAAQVANGDHASADLKKKARTDEHLSLAQKKALDVLVKKRITQH